MPTLGTVVCMWLEESLKNASAQKQKQILKSAVVTDIDDVDSVGTRWYYNELKQLDRYKHPLIKILISCAGDDDWTDMDREGYMDIINRYS